MKAKEVVSKMLGVVENIKDGSKVADAQFAIFADCALSEFKRIMDHRFRVKSGTKLNSQSLLSVTTEFSDWGTCIARRAKFPWLRESCGLVAFAYFLDKSAEVVADSGVVFRDFGAISLDEVVNIIRTGS